MSAARCADSLSELLRKPAITVLSGKNHMFSNEDRAFDKITDGGGRAERKTGWDTCKIVPRTSRSSFG